MPKSTRPATISATSSAMLRAEVIDEMPYSRLTMPTPRSVTEGASKLDFSKPWKFFSLNAAAISTTTHSAATTKNSSRQPNESTMKPESVGPIAGANPIASPIRPMALPRFSRGMVSNISVNDIGMMMPVENAIITRAARIT